MKQSYVPRVQVMNIFNRISRIHIIINQFIDNFLLMEVSTWRSLISRYSSDRCGGYQFKSTFDYIIILKIIIIKYLKRIFQNYNAKNKKRK